MGRIIFFPSNELQTLDLKKIPPEEIRVGIFLYLLAFVLKREGDSWTIANL